MIIKTYEERITINKQTHIINHLYTKNINQETLDKMRRIRLFGMHHEFKSDMETPRLEPNTAGEMTLMLIESEWDNRHNRALDIGLGNTRFCYKATIEQ
jgi:hypothetical protein